MARVELGQGRGDVVDGGDAIEHDFGVEQLRLAVEVGARPRGGIEDAAAASACFKTASERASSASAWASEPSTRVPAARCGGGAKSSGCRP